MERRPARMLRFGCYASLSKSYNSRTPHTPGVKIVTKRPSPHAHTSLCRPHHCHSTLRLSETPTCGRRSTSSWQQALSKLLEEASRCLTSCPIFQSTAWRRSILFDRTASTNTVLSSLLRGPPEWCFCELELLSI